MKYVYVVGLEHSGTTLVSHLLSQHPNFLALGEVAPFLSSSHMDQYFRKWGEFPDATLCSCGNDWTRCEFWGGLIHLSGQNSEIPTIEKYKLLFKHVKKNRPPETVLVDSSKSISTLRLLIANKANLGIDVSDISIVFAVKDVRNFATSIAHKTNIKNSVLSNYRSFNWWFGQNIEMINFLKNSNISFWLSLYDIICFNVDALLSKQFESLGYDPVGKIDVSHSKSHIAMGNKNFMTRNRSSIVYDERWRKNRNAKLVYSMHRKARALNEYLYEYENDKNA